jgi:hypothetical protein
MAMEREREREREIWEWFIPPIYGDLGGGLLFVLPTLVWINDPQ